MMRAKGFLPEKFFSMIGMPKDAVLPVPVCAWPMISRPSSAWGIVNSWIGVGSSNPISLIALITAGLRFRSLKLPVTFFSNKQLLWSGEKIKPQGLNIPEADYV